MSVDSNIANVAMIFPIWFPQFDNMADADIPATWLRRNTKSLVVELWSCLDVEMGQPCKRRT